MNAEIIAVGTELLLGQIANTNAQFLSEKLASIGINLINFSAVLLFKALHLIFRLDISNIISIKFEFKLLT